MPPDTLSFLIDERLHASLVEVANRLGYVAYHIEYLGLKGAPDWKIELVYDRSFPCILDRSPADYQRSTVALVHWNGMPAHDRHLRCRNNPSLRVEHNLTFCLMPPDLNDGLGDNAAANIP